VEERVEQCLYKLQSLLPDEYPVRHLQKLIVEAPTTVFRLDHCDDITTLDDLPVDLFDRLTGEDGPYDMACMI
jgi:hypothetical protein